MGFSVGIDSIWTLLADGRRRKREEIFEFLDRAAAEASEIARIWREVCEGVVEGIYGDTTRADLKKDEVMARLGLFRNMPPYRAINEFYSLLSTAADGALDPEWMDRFIHGLASVITERDQALAIYQTLLDRMEDPVFLDSSHSKADLKDMAFSIAVLEKEAASLAVMARTIRTRYAG